MRFPFSDCTILCTSLDSKMSVKLLFNKERESVNLGQICIRTICKNGRESRTGNRKKKNTPENTGKEK